MLIAAVLLAASPAAAEKSVWARAKRPSKGSSEAIGGTSAGCLHGAVAVRQRGDGWRVMRPERRRHFAHRALRDVIRELGAALKAEALGFLPLGDLSQPRGGPAPDGHASHQTGIDVDIWYAVGWRGKKPRPVPMVDGATKQPTAAFGSTQARVLELAARDARVDRIFVNPVLKRALCERTTGDRGWLRKLRPWWGHDEHFHVRLVCPTGSPDCVPQAEIPDGDGCDELDRWLSPDPEATAAKAEERKTYRKRIGTKPALPERCARVAR